MSTRVFQGKDQKCWRVSVQVSFPIKSTAEVFAKYLDRLKAEAALEGSSFSRRLLYAMRPKP